MLAWAKLSGSRTLVLICPHLYGRLADCHCSEAVRHSGWQLSFFSTAAVVENDSQTSLWSNIHTQEAVSHVLGLVRKVHSDIMCSVSVQTRVGVCLLGVFAALFAAGGSAAPQQESPRTFKLPGAAIRKHMRRPRSGVETSRASPAHRGTVNSLDSEDEAWADPFRSPPRAPRHRRPLSVNTPLRAGEKLVRPSAAAN